MTHPYREELAGRLDLRRERLTLRPGELATYCPLDAELDREAAAALRQSPSVEEVETVMAASLRAVETATGPTVIGLGHAAQAIAELYWRRG